MTPQLGSVVLVPVASPQTVAAVHDYVKAWQNAEINIAKAKVKYENHERMTKAEKNGYIPMTNTTMLTTSAHIPSVCTWSRSVLETGMVKTVIKTNTNTLKHLNTMKKMAS